MKHPKLTVTARTVLGKQVKKLRREGILPANVYGKDLQSLPVQVPLKDFEAVFKEVGETGLIDLQVDGQSRPVLVKNLQMEHPQRLPLHVDFFQVNLKEKVKTMAPLETVGEPTAVTEKIGLMLQQISEIEVEALPGDLPEKIEVPVEHLAAIGDAVTVADLKIPADVTVLTDPGQTVVKIDELVVEEPEPVEEAPAEGEEGAAEGEAAEGEAAEGEEGKAETGEKEASGAKEEKKEDKKDEKKEE
ncbi:MAG: 50S ribosomal protein L25 [Candidatus Levybacteria bacterium]|nr:50S ribosomal protein L25 [Candidatus Levybacteria bacterium]